ncbi:hypothetical protein CTI12_AA481570 [Artemisia annua]|uniref:Uncharacterized protein n=1 Tax=Artemisia annua TaxID=35608 RepID=A0A2U1LK95_ARTAN|nr:hypothetical protein CTI12_AA481570 [Artemisia annua]
MMLYAGIYKDTLAQVFGTYRHYFSTLELSPTAVVDEDEESVLETPPTSSSSLKRTSQSKCSKLAKELELSVQDDISELEKRDMLDMTEIYFAEKYRKKSTWAVICFQKSSVYCELTP